MSSIAWRERRLKELRSDHDDAVGEFVERARAIPDSRWLVPRAEGKWTPAQESRHLVLYYEAFSADLRGERKMTLKGTPLKRFKWRLLGLPQILWRKRIPVAVRAVREVSPAWDETPRERMLSLLAERAREFDALFVDTWRGDPRRTVRHPWFGDLTLDEAMQMSSVHTRHHAAFLEGSTT